MEVRALGVVNIALTIDNHHGEHKMTPGLHIGSPAPSIKAQDLLRGDPIWAFQPGKIYIREFFVTSHGPCVPARARLVHVQKKYRDTLPE
ncbi:MULTISPECIES: hypothetical protein [Rhizobium]|uniref:Uncharacterized protein n=1 Tax=Rhizobium leguminosarum bv. viciae TaxID=387 RepID=A0A8G2IQS0_RHILV|nr:hypothetical protein [Rhizobium leguminosarum]NKK10458.1 hypothetical protein [Rhizobium leguminosarum bv. viciae]NKK23612.1 hypothetical protein [Rhizobium leguminosarum bv. viciae]TBX85077.1 hypothetical protein E0H31_35450 [Rhizobium leguminosarum bv. viciae]TBZ13233.1 hypothetical protein E0H52_28080 [Rhizobium leguminosarum bv. viciae]